MATDNISELLELLNTSESILTTNAEVESDIRKFGGTVLYSYNNIIIASEVSDALYVELSKDSTIEYLYEVPMKRYGDVNIDLIDQLDISRIGINIDVVSGKTFGSYIEPLNQSGSATIDNLGEAPLIINDDLTVSALTNEWFTYQILATGNTPILYEISATDIRGSISLSGDTITGYISKEGNFSIMIKVSNSVGFDTKYLVVTTLDETKITSKLVDYKKLGSTYGYEITSSGKAPKTYTASPLPSGLSLSGNIISGTLSETGTTSITLSVTGQTGYDSKVLSLNVGESPIITSSGSISMEAFSNFEYIITSTPSVGVSYSLTGALPKGLTFSINSITGMPLAPGIFNVILKANNPYGEVTKQLSIKITNLIVGDTIFKKGPYVIFGDVNTEMQIHWQDDITAADTIKWGTDEYVLLGSEKSIEYGDHQHKYIITGLTANTKYYYQIHAEFGSDVFEGSFTSAPDPSSTSLKFLAYGDSRTQIQRHELVAQQINYTCLLDPSYQTLILHMGDLVYNGNDESYWTSELFNYSYPNINTMMRNFVFQSAVGEHEFSGTSTLFTKYFPYSFADSRYYSYDYGSAHFVVLDLYTSYTTGSDQYYWLINDLSTSTKTWKFVYFHEPGWSAGGGHMNNTTIQTVMEPIFETFDVDMVFASHNHYYSRAMVPTAVSGKTIPHITTGGGGAPLHTPDLSYPYIITASRDYHFCKINIVDNHTLEFEAISSSGTILDSFTITK